MVARRGDRLRPDPRTAPLTRGWDDVLRLRASFAGGKPQPRPGRPLARTWLPRGGSRSSSTDAPQPGYTPRRRDRAAARRATKSGAASAACDFSPTPFATAKATATSTSPASARDARTRPTSASTRSMEGSSGSSTAPSSLSVHRAAATASSPFCRSASSSLRRARHIACGTRTRPSGCQGRGRWGDGRRPALVDLSGIGEAPSNVAAVRRAQRWPVGTYMQPPASGALPQSLRSRPEPRPR